MVPGAAVRAAKAPNLAAAAAAAAAAAEEEEVELEEHFLNPLMLPLLLLLLVARLKYRSNLDLTTTTPPHIPALPASSSSIGYLPGLSTIIWKGKRGVFNSKIDDLMDSFVNVKISSLFIF